MSVPFSLLVFFRFFHPLWNSPFFFFLFTKHNFELTTAPIEFRCMASPTGMNIQHDEPIVYQR